MNYKINEYIVWILQKLIINYIKGQGAYIMNIFLYIIWNTAYYKKEEIIKDLEISFTVHKILEIYWTPERFSENLSRFYGQKLPPKSFKEKACGIGPFTLVVIEDKAPQYNLRKTSRGKDENVNIHTFDKKILYREWTKPESRIVHSRIHGTNTIEETEHDLTLLTGLCPKEFIERKNDLPSIMKCDLVGADGWRDLKQLFYVLKYTCKYTVLRNFEGFPDAFHVGEHADIDILAENYEDVKRICKARAVFKSKRRVQCMVDISGTPTQFDFRYVGDGYYDLQWEKDILANRIEKNGIYIPDEFNYKYMLLYHALIHKLEVARDYTTRLDAMFGKKKWNRVVLINFLKDKGYSFSEPRDLSVYFNLRVVKQRVSGRRFIKNTRIALQRKMR